MHDDIRSHPVPAGATDRPPHRKPGISDLEPTTAWVHGRGHGFSRAERDVTRSAFHARFRAPGFKRLICRSRNFRRAARHRQVMPHAYRGNRVAPRAERAPTPPQNANNVFWGLGQQVWSGRTSSVHTRHPVVLQNQLRPPAVLRMLSDLDTEDEIEGRTCRHSLRRG